MMNGVLMTAGIDAVSIPAVRATEFNSRMADFYMSRNATEMISFVLDCHPEAARIYQLNPDVSAIHDLPGIKYYRLGESSEQTDEQQTRPLSIEETQRQAAENWRRNYYDKRARGRGKKPTRTRHPSGH